MKYVISRSSSGYDANPRCPGAQKELVSSGNKLVEAYTIEINSLEELHNLIKNVGYAIIVCPYSCMDFDFPEIEIYDSYRE